MRERRWQLLPHGEEMGVVMQSGWVWDDKSKTLVWLAPGSPAAVQAGCSCPVTDNEHGRGYHFVPGQNAPTFVVFADCKLHGLWLAADEEPYTDDDLSAHMDAQEPR